MKKLKGPYFVHFIEDSTSKIRSFKSKKAMDDFLKKFKVDYENGDWVEFAFQGEFYFLEKYYIDSFCD
jgi:hypothetical protein